jgi:hypothetical protein
MESQDTFNHVKNSKHLAFCWHWCYGCYPLLSAVVGAPRIRVGQRLHGIDEAGHMAL